MEQKSPDAFRTISEVAEWLGVPTHVLRFWESRFTQVKPVKRAGGRRYYRPSDMELLGGIRKLLHDDGLTIRGVQKLLREEGVKHVAALSPPLDLNAAEDEDDGNVVSLSARSRGTEAEVEDAEIATEAEEAAPPAVDAAIEDEALEPVDPEEDRPVAFTEAQDEETPAEAPEEAEAPETWADTPDTFAEDATPAADPLQEAERLDDVADGDLPDEEQAPPEEAIQAPGPEVVTSGALPPETDDEITEPPLAAEAPEDDDGFDEDAPAEPPVEEPREPALEVTAEDDGDIAAPPVPEPDATHPEPHLTRADPEPGNPEAPEITEAADQLPPEDAEEGSDWADEFASAPEEAPAPAGAVLVMPDIPADPMDGTLPPHIAPIAPRLRRLRAHHAALPTPHLRALSDRLQTLRNDHDPSALG
ncbi:MAG: MerR family transcriptional regulator [Maritimibacter harenae]